MNIVEYSRWILVHMFNAEDERSDAIVTFHMPGERTIATRLLRNVSVNDVTEADKAIPYI